MKAAMTQGSPFSDSFKSAEPWPTEIVVSPDRTRLDAAYDDGMRISLDAEYLRVDSPSAEVQGHSPSERRIVPGKRRVRIVGAEPVGSYAVRLVFDDGHESGIFTWGYLRTLAAERETRWRRYLAELAERGLTREA
jgi:DUF971 family protein